MAKIKCKFCGADAGDNGLFGGVCVKCYHDISMQAVHSVIPNKNELSGIYRSSSDFGKTMKEVLPFLQLAYGSLDDVKLCIRSVFKNNEITRFRDGITIIASKFPDEFENMLVVGLHFSSSSKYIDIDVCVDSSWIEDLDSVILEYSYTLPKLKTRQDDTFNALTKRQEDLKSINVDQRSYDATVRYITENYYGDPNKEYPDVLKTTDDLAKELDILAAEYQQRSDENLKEIKKYGKVFDRMKIIYNRIHLNDSEGLKLFVDTYNDEYKTNILFEEEDFERWMEEYLCSTEEKKSTEC